MMSAGGLFALLACTAFTRGAALDDEPETSTRLLQTVGDDLGPATSRDALWAAGVVRNFYTTCAFGAYYKYRWTTSVQASAADWAGREPTAAYQRWDAVNAFDLRDYNVQLFGASSGFSLGDGSLPAVCGVGALDSAITSWVAVGGAANATGCTGAVGTGGPACGCWACLPPAVGAFSTPISGTTRDVADTSFFVRTVVKTGMDGRDTVPASTAVSRIAAALPAAGSAPVSYLNSSALFGMLLSKASSTSVKASCAPGFSWFSLGTSTRASQLTLFCAASSASASTSQYARLRNTTSVRTVSGGTGSTVIANGAAPAIVWWADRRQCAVCPIGTSPVAACGFITNTKCAACTCDAASHLLAPCDGKTFNRGCATCATTAFKGDAFGHLWTSASFIPANGTARPRNTVTCAAGTSNRLSLTNTTSSTCTLATGWDVALNASCVLCDPPRVPFAVNPRPAIGSSNFTWSCAPGFSPSGSLSRTCPVTNGSAWSGTPLSCVCNGIGRTHSCSTSDGGAGDAWVSGTDLVQDSSWLRLRYSAVGGAWVTTGASARNELLGAITLTFSMGSASGQTYAYRFVAVPDAAAKAVGSMRFTNAAQFGAVENTAAGMFFANATAVVRAGSYSGLSWMPVPLATSASGNGSPLELWSGSESALRALSPAANAYFSITSSSADFFLDVRLFVVQPDGSSVGLLDYHAAREAAQGVRAQQGGVSSFYSKRAVVAATVDWLTRTCPAGQYQVGSVCRSCPSGSFSATIYKALTPRPDGSLPPINGSLASGAMCQPCSCPSCATCAGASGACVPMPSTCLIAGVCTAPGVMAPSSQCSMCDPTSSTTAYSPLGSDRKCDDGNPRTFGDTCDGYGGCIGTLGSCLADPVDLSVGCEVYGRDGCEPRPDFKGCVSTDATGARGCGCSINGVCYAHLAVNPANQCQRCDVTMNSAGWSASPPQPCNDGKNCTYGDMCYLGRCAGLSLTCAPSGPCVQSSTCDGSSVCAVQYKPATTKCDGADGACTASAYCTGRDGVCPLPTVLTPVIFPGFVAPAPPVSPFPFGRAALLSSAQLSALSFAATLAASGPPATSAAFSSLGYPSVSLLGLALTNWSAPCGALQFRLGLFTGSAACSSVAVTDVPNGGRGWAADWQSGPVLRRAEDSLTSPSPAGVVLDALLAAPVADGTALNARLEVRSGESKYAAAVSARCISVIFDATAPTAGWIRNLDPTLLVDRGANVAAVRVRRLSFIWGGFSELIASTWGGQLQYRFCVSSSPGGCSVVPWRWVPAGALSAATVDTDLLPLNTPLQVTLQAFNRAGLSVSVVATPVAIDVTGPVITASAFVFNGLRTVDGAPVHTLARSPADPSTLSAQWDGFVESDPFSSIDRFEVAFGYSAGDAQLYPFTAVPGGPSARAYFVPFNQWTLGVKYFATVRAVDVSGASSQLSSIGMWNDATPPADVAVAPTKYGYGACSGLRVTYSYSELESAVMSAVVTAGRSEGADDLLAATTITSAGVSSGFDMPSLPGSINGRRVFLRVKLVNAAGLMSDSASMNYIEECSFPVCAKDAVDTAPSNAGGSSVTFHNGPGLAGAWGECSDEFTSVVSTQVRVVAYRRAATAGSPGLADFVFGSAAAATDVAPWSEVGPVTSALFSSLMPTVVNGWTYYYQVRSTNAAGSFVIRTSAGVVVDTTPPLAVVSLLSSNAAFLASTSSLVAVLTVTDWESGLSSVQVGVGFAGAGVNVLPWQAVSLGATNVTLSGLTLVPGATYSLSVQATNRAGLVTVQSSQPFTIDPSPPLRGSGLVLDGLTGLETDYALSIRNGPSATWAGLCADPESGISFYSVCAGSSPGLCDIVPVTRMPANVTASTLPFTPAAAYCSALPGRLLIGSDEEEEGDEVSTVWEEDLDARSAADGARQLQSATGAQTAALPSRRGPEWYMQLDAPGSARLCSAATSLNSTGSVTFCVGGGLPPSVVETVPSTTGFTGFFRELSVLSLKDGRADVGVRPSLSFRSALACGTSAFRSWNVTLRCLPSAVTQPAVLSQLALPGSCSNAYDVGLAAACGGATEFRASPAAAVGPLQQYAGRCVSSMLLSATTNASRVWTVCPFGGVSSYDARTPSNATTWGFFDGWKSPAVTVPGSLLYGAMSFSGGGTAAPCTGLAKAVVSFVCSTGGARLVLRVLPDVTAPCTQRIVVAVPDACGAGMAAPITAPVPSATSTPLPDQYFLTKDVMAAPLPSNLPAPSLRTKPRAYYGPQALAPILAAAPAAVPSAQPVLRRALAGTSPSATASSTAARTASRSGSASASARARSASGTASGTARSSMTASVTRSGAASASVSATSSTTARRSGSSSATATFTAATVSPTSSATRSAAATRSASASAVATASALPPFSRLSATDSGARDWIALDSSASGAVIAAVERVGLLYVSADRTGTWTAASLDSQSWLEVAVSADGTSIVAAAADVSSVFMSSDTGRTWVARAVTGGTNGAWTGIASSADGSTIVACTGSSSGRVYSSTDSGLSWQTFSASPPGFAGWAAVDSSRDGTILVAAAAGQHVHMSYDAGATWTVQVSSGRQSWTSVSSSSDGRMLVAAAVAIVMRSTDAGSTWSPVGTISSALPAVTSWSSVVSSDDGSRIALASSSSGLAFVSTDSGSSWLQMRSSGEPSTGRAWSAIALTVDGSSLAAAAARDFVYVGALSPPPPAVLCSRGPSMLLNPGVAAALNVSATLTASLVVCPFVSVSLDFSRGTAPLLLGYWDSWTLQKSGGSTSYDRLLYTGRLCASGAPLLLFVTPQCGSSPTQGQLLPTAQAQGVCSLAVNTHMPAICPFASCSPSFSGQVYTSVDCVNGAGASLQGGPAVSDGMTVDQQPPTLGVVTYAAPPPAAGAPRSSTLGDASAVSPFYFSSTPLALNIVNFSGVRAPVRSFSVAVGSSAGGSDVLLSTPSTASTFVDLSSIAFQPGSAYYPTVTAFSAAGASSVLAVEVPAVFDPSAPTAIAAGAYPLALAAAEASSPPLAFQPFSISRTTLRVCARGVREPQSPLAYCELALGGAGATSVSSSQGVYRADASTMEVSSPGPLRVLRATDVLLSSASSVTASGDIILRPAPTGSAAIAVSAYRISVDRDFKFAVAFSLSPGSTMAAGDSIALVVHNDPRGPSAVASAGGRCAGVTGGGAITPGVAIVFGLESGGNYSMGVDASLGSTTYSNSSCTTVRQRRWRGSALNLTNGEVYIAYASFSGGTSGSVTYGIYAAADAARQAGPYMDAVSVPQLSLGTSEAYFGVTASFASSAASWRLSSNVAGLGGFATVRDTTVVPPPRPNEPAPGSVSPVPYPATVCATFSGLSLPVGSAVDASFFLVNAAGLPSAPLRFKVSADDSLPGPMVAWVGAPATSMSSAPVETQAVLSTSTSPLQFYFSLPTPALGSSIGGFSVAVGTAGDSAFAPDVIPWAVLPLASLTSLNVTAADGSARTVFSGAVTPAAPLPVGVRLRVAVAGFNSLGPDVFVKGYAPLSSAASVAISGGTFVFDTTPPTLDLSAWAGRSPIAVISPGASVPPSEGGMALSFADVTAVLNRNVTFSWARPVEVHSRLSSVSLSVDVNSASTSSPSVDRVVLLDWTSIEFPATTTSFSVVLPPLPNSRGQFASDWMSGPPQAATGFASSVASFGFAAGVRLPGVTQAACAAVCASAADCVAFQWIVNTATGANCFPVRFYADFAPASSNRLIVAAAAVQPTFRVSLRVANTAGLSQITTQDFVLDAGVPAFRAPGVVALADSLCSAAGVDLATQGTGIISWSPNSTTGTAQMCVGFRLDTGVAAVSAFTIAVGSTAGASDLLPWWRPTAADLVTAGTNGPSSFDPELAFSTVRLRTLPFRTSQTARAFVSVRAYSSAGQIGSTTSGPIILVLVNAASSVGFFVWPSAGRSNVTAVDGSAKSVPLSWTGPGGDAAMPGWSDATSSGIIPGGLLRFDVAVSATATDAGILPGVGWVPAGTNQSAVVRGVLDPCAPGLTSSAAAGSYGWSFAPPPHSLVGSGNPGAGLRAANESACCGACRSASACSGWTFSVASTGSNCFLFQYVRTAVESPRSISGVVGVSVKPLSVAPSRFDLCSAGSVFTGMAVRTGSGADVALPDPSFPSGVVVASMAACCAVCHRSPRCLFYQWTPSEDVDAPNCLPMMSTPSYDWLVATEGATIGVAGTSASRCGRNVPSTSFNSFVAVDAASVTPSTSDCCARCEATAFCTAWQWSSNSSTCTMAATVASVKVADSTFVMGFMAYFVNQLSLSKDLELGAPVPPPFTGIVVPGVVPASWPTVSLALPGTSPANVTYLMPAPAESALECAAACRSADGCFAGVFDAAAATCALVTSFHRFVSAPAGSQIATVLPSTISSAPLYGLVGVVAQTGLRTFVPSLPFSVATSTPIVGEVRTVVSAVVGGLQLACAWPAWTDPSGGVLRYSYGAWVGRTGGVGDGLAAGEWTDAAGLTAATLFLPSTALVGSITVACAVRACTAATICQWSTAMPSVVDFTAVTGGRTVIAASRLAGSTAPSAVNASNATNLAVARFDLGSLVTIAWAPFVCQRSSVARYELCVSDFIGGCNLFSGPATGNVMTATVRLQSPAAGAAVVYAGVTAICGSGSRGSQVSAGTLNDVTAPSAPGAVTLTSSTLRSSVVIFPSAMDRVTCAWTRSLEPETGFLGLNYTVSLSASLPATNVSSGQTQRVFRNASATGLSATFAVPLWEGRVYCSVSATNAAGITGAATASVAAYGDWSPPTFSLSAAVSDGPTYGVDLDLSGEAPSQLSATWSGFSDGGSGILRYEACVDSTNSSSRSASPAACSVAAWQTTAGLSSHAFTGLSLVSGRRYFVCVRAWDVLGLFSLSLCSGGVLVDSISPIVAAAVNADVALERYRQNASLATKGWRFAHLFGSTSFVPSASALNLTGVYNVSAATADVLRLSALVAAAGVRPRLSVGAKTSGGASVCKLSTYPTDVTVPLSSAPSTNDSTALFANVTVGGNRTFVAVGCVAGMEMSSVLNACVPCADGWFKARAGLDACRACPANTASAAAAAAALVTDISQQSRRMMSVGGPVSCGCWDASQTFVAGAGCVCAAGTLPNLSRLGLAPSFTGPPMCVPVVPSDDGRDHKPTVGDDPLLVDRCPVGSSASTDMSTCVCATASQAYSPASRTCSCGPNLYAVTRRASVGNVTACVLCPSATVKPSFGNSAADCRACPWGTVPSPGGGPGCDVDTLAISGPAGSSALLPDATAVACAPGNAASGWCGILSGVTVMITAAVPKTLASTKVGSSYCVPLPRSVYTGLGGTPILGGVALIAGVARANQVAVQDSAEARNGTLLFAPLMTAGNLTLGAETFLPNGTQRVAIGEACVSTKRACSASCSPCTSGTFQPSFIPLPSASLAQSRYGDAARLGALGQCSLCPGLLRGSSFAASDRTLVADWTGVFSDNGTGIVKFEYAVGNVPGGSQVVPFTDVEPDTTTVTLRADDVVTGTPMYLTVVAVDAVGNRGVLEDSRPVLVDDTSPLPGVVHDLNLDDLLGSKSVAAYLVASGATASTATSIVTVTDTAMVPRDASGTQLGSLRNSTRAATAVLAAALSDSATANASSTRTALATLTIPAPVAGNVSRNVTTTAARSWRTDQTFTSLYGFPDADYSPSTSSYSFTWEPFLDTGSGRTALAYCLGSLPYACDVRPLTRIPAPLMSVDTLQLSNLSLPAGEFIYATVMAVNGVGMVSMGCSNGLVPDDRPPSPGTVYDVGRNFDAPLRRTGDTSSAELIATDIDCDVQSSGIGMVWEDFSAKLGLDHYECAVGTKPGGSDLQAFTPVGLVCSCYAPNIAPPVGSTVFSSVRAVGINGQSVVVSSNGVRILGDDVDMEQGDRMFRCVAPRGNATVGNRPAVSTIVGLPGLNMAP